MQRYMGGFQNWGSILVPLNTRCRNIIYNQKAPTILRTTRIGFEADLLIAHMEDEMALWLWAI